jgi:hypothetical protein
MKAHEIAVWVVGLLMAGGAVVAVAVVLMNVFSKLTLAL